MSNIMINSRFGSPGDLCRLSMTCKKLKDFTAAAEDLWKAACAKQGFRYQASQGVWVPTKVANGWFAYYSTRMLVRWRVRTLMKRLRDFLPIDASSCFRPGLPAETLLLVESRLHCELPWEIWELYRYKDGQENRVEATFAYDGRLLALQEPVRLALIPFTDEFGSKRRYMFDLMGRIYLQSGFTHLLVADNLVAFLHSLLR
ncbi:hypothetical protein WJX72_002922 [[Myrmecia] bisecta]|uniref:F-box domain-containing protein n=1 Tax=[Myrmecia] bisecta TaxID=41462 RepID=A0AAW1QPN9_9CHLO